MKLRFIANQIQSSDLEPLPLPDGGFAYPDLKINDKDIIVEEYSCASLRMQSIIQGWLRGEAYNGILPKSVEFSKEYP